MNGLKIERRGIWWQVVIESSDYPIATCESEEWAEKDRQAFLDTGLDFVHGDWNYPWDNWKCYDAIWAQRKRRGARGGHNVNFCRTCEGWGKTLRSASDINDWTRIVCPTCGGTGRPTAEVAAEQNAGWEEQRSKFTPDVLGKLAEAMAAKLEQ